MKKNLVALTSYRTVKAANDDGSSAVAVSNPAPSYLAAEGRGGWDPFEVWRTRIHVVIVRHPRKR